MKVILLQHLSGATSHEVGEEMECSDFEAVRFINAGIAKVKTPKAHNDLMAKVEQLEKEEADKRSKMIAIQKEDELKGEANALLDDLVAIVSTLATMDEAFPGEFLKLIETKFTEGK